MRGEREIKAAALEAQKAATRNAHKQDWHRVPLCKLFDLLDEERDEFYEAVLSGDPEQIKAEAGDVSWVVTMIADHGGHLISSEPAADEESLKTGPRLPQRSFNDEAESWVGGTDGMSDERRVE